MSRKRVIPFTYVSTPLSFDSNFALTGLLWGVSKSHNWKNQEEIIFRDDLVTWAAAHCPLRKC